MLYALRRHARLLFSRGNCNLVSTQIFKAFFLLSQYHLQVTMKPAVVLVSLLPFYSATVSISHRETAESLPVIEGDTSHHVNDASESQPSARSGLSASSAQLCQPGYPFYCNGRCCPLNRCCARQCCGSRTTFCGADGLCYI